MLARMSPQLFDEWLAAHRLDRWGDENFQAIAIGVMIVNAVRKSAGGENFKESDLLPLDFFVAKPPPDIDEPTGTTPDEFLTIMKARIGM